MRIKQTSLTSFKSTPLYNVKVKKKDGSGYKERDAVFSKLDPFDSEDFETVQKLKEEWGLDTFVVGIAHNFKPVHYKQIKEYFYAIELKGDEPLSERIVSICEISSGPFSKCHMPFIQSKPVKDEEKDIKGGGEVLIYGVIKEFKNEEECKKIELNSITRAIGFYRHIGFKHKDFNDLYCMELPKDDFEAYITRVEKKYGF